MRFSSRSGWVLVACTLIVSGVSAQTPPVAETLPADRLSPDSIHFGWTAAIQDDGDVVYGLGADYKTLFHHDTVEFIPALGHHAPHNMPLRLTLQSVGREDGAPTPASDLPNGGARVVDDLRIEYDRGWVTERYDVRSQDIEQSFVFDRLPEGNGDLVVRLGVDTELVPVGNGDEIHFHYGDLGSVRVGDVVGIDADGMRAAGELLLEEGVLSLSLPADFVDRARLPLILDPLIGSNFDVRAISDERPDVAYDRTENVYLVTYEFVLSGSDNDVRGAFVTPSGAVPTSTISIESSLDNETDIHCANVNVRDAFLVVWYNSTDTDIVARAVRATDGSVSAPRVIAGAGESCNEPDVGGEWVPGEDDAIVVWDNDTTNEIEAAQVQITSSFAVGVVLSRTAIRSGSNTTTQPTISKSGGEPGQFLICWQETVASEPRIYGAVYDRNVIATDTFVSIASSSTLGRWDPACDGDGRRWLVAYERDETSTSFDTDIYARTVWLDGTVARVLSGEQAIESTGSDDEENPDVAWMGNSALVCFSDESTTAGVYETRVYSVNHNSCLNCEGSAVPDSRNAFDVELMACASRFSGGPFSAGGSALIDDALVVWEAYEVGVTNGGEIVGRIFDTRDGSVANLGGSCGAGGDAFVSCANAGGNFNVQLLDAANSVAAWLVLSPNRLDFPCSTCTLVPDPFLGVALPTSTNSVGVASEGFVIPSSAEGVRIYAQFAVLDATPTCSSIGVDLSDAFSISVQN